MDVCVVHKSLRRALLAASTHPHMHVGACMHTDSSTLVRARSQGCAAGGGGQRGRRPPRHHEGACSHAMGVAGRTCDAACRALEQARHARAAQASHQLCPHTHACAQMETIHKESKGYSNDLQVGRGCACVPAAGLCVCARSTLLPAAHTTCSPTSLLTLQVVTVETGGLTQDHSSKARLFFVSWGSWSGPRAQCQLANSGCCAGCGMRGYVCAPLSPTHHPSASPVPVAAL